MLEHGQAAVAKGAGAPNVAETHEVALDDVPREDDDPVLPCLLGNPWLGIGILPEGIPGCFCEFEVLFVGVLIIRILLLVSS